MPTLPQRRLSAPFLALVIAVHAAALLGYLVGGFPLGIAAEGLDLLGVLDALILIPLAILRCWGLGKLVALLAPSCLLLALGPPLFWPASGAPGLARPVRLLQANIMSEGLPASALGGRVFDVAAIAEWRAGDDDSWARSMGLRLAAHAPGRGDAALFSRWPAVASGCILDETGWCQAVWALLDTPQGKLRVISLHTMSPPGALRIALRDRFLVRLEAFIATLPPGEPLVAAGDFNSTWGSPSMRRLGSSVAWNSERQRAPSWPSLSARFGLGFRIDHQLGAKGAVVDSQEVFDSGYSDHLWTSALVHLPAQPARPGGR